MNAKELDIVARTVYGEARGEIFTAKIAVAWCIRNRVELDLRGDGMPDWWGEGYEAVCLKKFQFSCWNANDVNRAKLLRVTVEVDAFRECIAAAALALTGMSIDPTNGCHHYHRYDLKPFPAWTVINGVKIEPSKRIGAHVFYNDMRIP